MLTCYFRAKRLTKPANVRNMVFGIQLESEYYYQEAKKYTFGEPSLVLERNKLLRGEEIFVPRRLTEVQQDAAAFIAFEDHIKDHCKALVLYLCQDLQQALRYFKAEMPDLHAMHPEVFVVARNLSPANGPLQFAHLSTTEKNKLIEHMWLRSITPVLT